MKTLAIRIGSVIALVMALASYAGAQAPAAKAPPPIPFPPHYDFPTPAATIQLWVTTGNVPRIREHGWSLWAGLNQPGYAGWPIWRSWPIATQVFATGPIIPTATSGAATQPHRSLRMINVANNPIVNLDIPFYIIPNEVRMRHPKALEGIGCASAIPDGDNFQNNGDLMLVSEAFSQPAYKSIRDHRYYYGPTLTDLLAKGNTDISGMNSQSIVLKYMYWPVKQTGLTALPVADMANYDKAAVPDTTYIGFENVTRWSQAVAIDPTRKVIPPGETAPVTYLHGVYRSGPGTKDCSGQPRDPIGPTTYENARIVPLADFYFKRISAADYAALSTYDQVLLDSSFYWATGRVFEPGDYLVAVASHIVTKEIPYWTLQSVWWHPSPNDSKYAANRPSLPNAKGPWRHYLMTVEYGIPQANGDLPIAYNPYIELASHPVTTNCRNCHIRATWPTGQYITQAGPSSLADLALNNSIFKGLLHTDFLWTIADRAYRPPGPK